MLSREDKQELEVIVMKAHRDRDEGKREDIDELEPPPWMVEHAMQSKLVDEKTIVQAFFKGIMKAHRWPSDIYEPPPHLDEVMRHVSRAVQLLRFNFNDGLLRMSLNSIVDQHMRIWIKDSIHMQEWIAADLLTTDAVLRGACFDLIAEREYFAAHFKGALGEYRQMIREEVERMDRQAARTMNELEEKEKKIRKRKAERDKPTTPSGMHPAI